jgi:hypothetical protein
MQFSVLAIAAPLAHAQLAIEVARLAFNIATSAKRIAFVNIALSA